MTYRLHYAPDNASLVIRLALEELRQPYDFVLVDRAAAGHKAPAYLKLNPNGLIPVLETPDGALWETGAILLWLADTHGALAPAVGDGRRGNFLKWLFFVSNTLHADLRMLFYPAQYLGPRPEAARELRAALKVRLTGHLKRLDKAVAEWTMAPETSILDWYVVCVLRWMALYPAGEDRSWFRLSDTPALAALAARLEILPATQAAQAAEGLGPTPFTAPVHPTPPEGSAT